MCRNIGKVTSFSITQKSGFDRGNRQHYLLQVEPSSRFTVAPVVWSWPLALSRRRGIWFGGFGESIRGGVGSRLGPVSGVGFIEDVAYVMVHGPRADE